MVTKKHIVIFLAIFELQFHNSQIMKCEKIFQSSFFFKYHRCHAVISARKLCLWIQVSFLPRIACLRQSTQVLVYNAPKSQIALPRCLLIIFPNWSRVNAGTSDLLMLEVSFFIHSKQMVVFAHTIAQFSN